MSRLVWWKSEERLTQGGIDRAVLYPKDKPAVPWNGLSSVNESGSQSSSTYYVDGQKYLTTVTPREYSGTISAYTFPDEFAEICGIVEAADGLFLDSQVPDQFGLCYRTMYNDGLHYKLHLIYGVTAAMSDVEYQSLGGGSNDPSMFEFDIAAIPQSIDGFRPTAHVIIDSRHLEQDILNRVENLLYGTFNQEAQLPNIKTLFEIMSYGDLVVVTDNGDGTWTAEGSRKWIYEDPDTGEFIIDNVVAQDNGDGTYLFCGTNEPLVVPPPPVPLTDIDGGTPTSQTTDVVDGGASIYAGTDTQDGGTPLSNSYTVDGGTAASPSGTVQLDGGTVDSSGSTTQDGGGV